MISLSEILPFQINGNEIFSSYNLFIIFIALCWMTVASIQDFKRREVENWWNFSLIAFVLSFKAFLSIYTWNYMYIVYGVLGLLAGFLLANAFYYARLFAGGDAKLLMALGSVLMLSFDWRVNLALIFAFLMLMLVIGAIYGGAYSIFLMAFNFRDFLSAFRKILGKYTKIIFSVELAGIAVLISLLLIKAYAFAVITALMMISPIILAYGRAIEDACMNGLVDVSKLTTGDWIVKPVKIGKGRIIKPNWEGLSEEDVEIIKESYNGKVLVKQGIPFVPVFLLAFAALLTII